MSCGDNFVLIDYLYGVCVSCVRKMWAIVLCSVLMKDKPCNNCCAPRYYFVAPNSPKGLAVDTRTSTSVTISWYPVVYTNKIYSIQQYQVGYEFKEYH